MKKILLLSLVASFGLSYEGCGVTKKDALNNLSQSIYVNVNNRFKKEEKLTIGLFEEFNKKVESQTTQSSNLTLKNVKYIKTKNGWCAKVTQEDVKKTAKEDLNYLLSFNISDLPKEFDKKQNIASALLAKIAFVKAMASPTKSNLRKINKLEKFLTDLSNKGEVVFNLNIPDAKIKIAGMQTEYSPSSSILLPEGEYSYTITAPNRCPLSGTFVVKAKNSFTINKELLDYPIITFTSNQKSVRLLVDGKNRNLNTPIKLDKCDGKLVWSMAFEDKVESGEIELEGGLKDTITQNFISTREMEKLKEKVKYYTHSQEVVISYGYAISDEEEKPQWDEEKRIEIRKFNNYGIYKLGFGILAGTQTKWTASNMNELEIAISARVQIPEFLYTTLHIYKMPIIPYLGVEGGWDIYKFIDEGNYDANDITSILRGTFGITMLFHKQFGINVEYSHDFAQKKDNVFTAGIVMDF